MQNLVPAIVSPIKKIEHVVYGQLNRVVRFTIGVELARRVNALIFAQGKKVSLN
jgi:hypothetical protein